MNEEERRNLVHFMGMARATQFAIGTIEKRMTGTVKGTITACYSMLQTTLSMLLKPVAWQEATADDHEAANRRKKKAEVLGAALYEVSREFQLAGYRPEALLLLKGFNAGDVVMPNGTPMRELDVMAAPGPEPEDIITNEQRTVLEEEVHYMGLKSENWPDDQKAAFYLQLAERFAVIGMHYANV